MIREQLLREGIAALRGGPSQGAQGFPGSRPPVTDSPQLDAELLLAHILEVSRTTLRTHPSEIVADADASRFFDSIARRVAGEPLAYILGTREFYSREFEVDRSVLIPRPDTEILVEWALELWRPGESVLELGVGSGCVTVTLAAERPQLRVTAVDISPAALQVAGRNARRHGVEDRVLWIEGDRLEQVGEPHDWIISNPPYVALDDPQLEANVERYEPALALRDVLDGDGLGFYRYLAQHLRTRDWPRQMLLEVGNDQAAAVQQIFEPLGCATETRKDLAGIERVVRVQRG